MNHKKTKKFLATTLIFIQIIGALFPFGIKAATLLTPMAISPEIEALLGESGVEDNLTDSDTLSYSAGNKKLDGPQVTVIFDPSRNVQEGQEITAKATTAAFTKGNPDLYFTWYIKHAACELSNNPSSSVIDACDLDGDEKITVNDWKIEAARTIARGNFEPTDSTYSGEKKEADRNADGFQAYFGNDIKNGSSAEDAHCYFLDYNTGRIFEMQKIRPAFLCPTGYTQQCVKTRATKLSCNYKSDPFNGALPEDETNYDVDEQKDVCQAVTNNDSLNDEENPNCKFQTEGDIDIYKLTVSCDNSGETAVCVPNMGTDNGILSFGTENKSKIFNQGVADTSMCSTFGRVAYSGTGGAGNVCPTDTSTISSSLATCTYEKDVEEDNDGNMCKHMFAQLDPDERETGNGSYSMEEEKMFLTNPAPGATKTAGNSKLDEANVVGLGIDEFKWQYRSGDMVGVIVEGTYIKETQHNDASKMTMWALPLQQCKAMEDVLDDNKGGFYRELQGPEGSTQKEEKILAAEFDFDDCLEENLLDPMGSSSFDVAVSYDPKENIYYDPVENAGKFSRGTLLNATANVSGMTIDKNGNSISPSSLKYYWKVDVPRNRIPVPPIDSDPWRNINEYLDENIVFEGFGMNNFALNLNIPDRVFADPQADEQYIRLRVEVEQPGGMKGRGTVIVKIKKIDDSKSINVYGVEVTESTKLTLLDGAGKELCDDPEGKYVCQATENEIVGLKASADALQGFQWTVNNQPVSCPSTMSDECGAGNIIFMPIQQPEDGTDMISVKLTATDKDTLERVQIERFFKIVKPSIIILSGDLRILGPKLFGHYRDESGQATIPDYSEMSFEAIDNAQLPVYLSVMPSWKKESANIEWSLNGMPLNYPPNTTDILIDPEGANEVFVDAQVTYGAGAAEQEVKIRQALYKYWNISPSAVNEDMSSAQVWITINKNEALAKGKNTFFGATLLGNLPQHILFLSRLMITGFLILLVSGISFSLMGPRTREELI